MDQMLTSSELSNTDSKPGIVYLSSIPRRMNVKHVRQFLSVYGAVNRIFLQPNGKVSDVRKNRVFSEGWVEFSSKRVARHVAATLNNTPVGGKRRTPWYSDLWNIKYLPRFTWGLLNERLTYERAIRKRRLRTEVAIAKRETAQFISSAQHAKSRRNRQQRGSDGLMKTCDSSASNEQQNNKLQNEGEELKTITDSRSSSSSKHRDKSKDNDLLVHLFCGGLDGSG